MKKNITIYSDEGVGALSLLSVRHYFSSHTTQLISAQDIIEDGIPKNTDIFVMPGGADKPYAKKLNGIGNQKIKEYVEQGGTYLGICAGAYYGCSAIEFQKGTNHEICEDRELGFYKGIGIGCLSEITKPYNLSLESAAITQISMANKKVDTFYWGGCHFGLAEHHNATVIASYDTLTDKPAAIISCAVGQGKAILSGVHFEVSSEVLQEYNFENEADNNLKTQLARALTNTKTITLEDLFITAERKAA